MEQTPAQNEETKIIYHIDEEDTPYLIKLPVPHDRVTLGDFKNALNRPNYKFFFKSMDDDFGVVKEEITEDDAHLPCFNGRVVSWLVTADGSNVSDTQSQSTDHHSDHLGPHSSGPVLPGERLQTIPGDSRPPSFHAPHGVVSGVGMGPRPPGAFDPGEDTMCDTCTDTDSVYSAQRDRVAPLRNFHDYKHGSRLNGQHKGYPPHMRSNNQPPPIYSDTVSSMMSSDLESTSFFDSEDESSRFSTATGTTMSSKYGRHRKQRRRRRMPPISRASSFSSITDSTMSLNIVTVTLNMDTVNFLGISIVGQSNKGGDGGIYVGSIMKGGAVAQDGRIEPGDMILEVNGISFENMSNDDAVRSLREQVQKPGPITLVVAKCWDPNPKGYFTIPRQEPVRPIDPRAWVLHTNAMTQGEFPGPAPAMPPPAGPRIGAPSLTTMTSTSSSITSSLPESERYPEEVPLTVNTDMATVVRVMAQPDSGLEIRNRIWLKITIPNAFMGSDLVDWLCCHVDGFADRRDARKYACNLLKFGFIRHTVNKVTFSEQCYYVFGDLAAAVSQLSLEELDSVSEADRDTLAPLPPPNWGPNPPTAAGPGAPPSYRSLMQTGAQQYAGYSTETTSQYSSLPPPSMGGPPPPPLVGAPPSAAQPPQQSAPSVHSGSAALENCVCIQSTYKAVKSLWEKDKPSAEPPASSVGTSTGASPKPQGSPLPRHATRLNSVPLSAPPPLGTLSESHSSDDSGSSASGGSRRSGGGGSGGRQGGKPVLVDMPPPMPSLPSQVGDAFSESMNKVPPPPPPPRDLSRVNEELSGSKQSFRMAMGNPSM